MQTSASTALAKSDCPSGQQTAAFHRCTPRPSFAVHTATTARKAAAGMLAAARVSSGSSQSACQRRRRHPSSFTVAFAVVEFAFAFTESPPKSSKPFGLGQSASASSAAPLGRLGPSSSAATGSPASARARFVAVPPCPRLVQRRLRLPCLAILVEPRRAAAARRRPLLAMAALQRLRPQSVHHRWLLRQALRLVAAQLAMVTLRPF